MTEPQPDHNSWPFQERRQRALTDADVAAIVLELKKSVVADFYNDVGRGVWTLVKRCIFTAMLMMAAYGSLNSNGWLKKWLQ